MELVLDAGALSALAGRAGRARVQALRDRGLWPPIVPSVICVEALTGHGGRDAAPNRLLKACDVVEHLDLRTARRAGSLRFAARRGSAVDAIVVAVAEQQGGAVVLTTDVPDLSALAAKTKLVSVATV
jgi:predicted nucleic acid-binding protein